jgi:uncharacterized protein (TIGR03437 family)
MKLHLLLLLGAALLPAQSVVISQVYGGGGNTGATWRNDFVELFNRGTETVSVAGWTVEYGSATGTTWQASALAGAIEPGRYYLIQLAAGTGGTQSLPAPDAVGTLALGGTAGKIRVRNGEAVVDLVGYGVTANEFKTAPTRDLSNTTAAIRAGAGCVDTGNNGADFVAGPPVPRNSATARNDCSAVPVGAERLSISQIQGRGAVSPVVDRRVITRGVVYARRTNGFYIQSLPGDRDADDATSEGLLIFGNVQAPAVGTVVDVEGVVTEFGGPPTLTELTSPVVTVLRTGEPLPEPEWLVGSDWERLEGMRVQGNWNVIGPTGGTFNETRGDSTSNGIFWAAPATARPFRRPGLDGDSTDGRVRVDSRALGGTALDLVPGDYVSVVGALDFGQRTYTVLAERTTVFASGLAPRGVPAAVAGEFTVGTLNLRRFFDSATGFAARMALAKQYIQGVLRSPDVLAVQEVGSLAALEKLAAELGGYRAYVGATNDPSGIAPGFLVKSGLTVSATSSAPNPDLVHDRPPFRLDVRIDGRHLVLICVHMRSLTDIADARVQEKRRAQAVSVNAMARGIAAEGLPFAILGDFNSFPFDDGYADILGLVAAGLGVTSVNGLLGNGDNHSYVFNGATQALDHMLVSAGMRGWLTRVAYGAANADFPEAGRVSDHDGLVGWFRFDSAPLTALGVVNAASFLGGSVAPGEVVSVFGRELTGTRVTVDGQEATAFLRTPGQWNVLIPVSVRVGGTVELSMEGVGRVELPVAGSAPGLFAVRVSGRRGEVVELWGTGGGTGLATEVRMCGLPAEVVYSGMNAGLWQVNARIPTGCPVGENRVEVSAGARSSQEIPVMVR